MILGKKKIAAILSQLKSEDAKDILRYIASSDSCLAEEIRESMFGFEGIVQLVGQDIKELHKRVDKKELLLAMKGADEQIKEHLLLGQSSRAKALYEEELELMGKVRRSDVEAARRHIAEVVRGMMESGEISLDDEWIE